MRSSALSRHYSILTPRERLPLLVAASVRGDHAEVEQLVRQAPTDLFRIPNYRRLAECMAHLALLHLIQTLEYAALLWKTEALLAKGAPHLHAQLHQVDGVYAYLLLVECDAWDRFCRELHIDPAVLIRDMPGYTTMQRAVEAARLAACTAEAALQSVQERWGPQACLPTVNELLADYRTALASREDNGQRTSCEDLP